MKWKKIEGYENYLVSSNGDVKNDKTGRILKKYRNKKGYETVNLYKNGKMKTFQVHRLVAMAFIPNPIGLPCIDHINTIRNDNRAENLKWCTHKENSNNPLTLENSSKAKKGENHPMYGKHHSEETKEKMRNSLKGKQPSEEAKEKMRKNHANVSGMNHPKARKIICITTGEVFDCIKQASEKYGVNNRNISKCCRKNYKSAGKHPETGEKLVWMYYEDYLKTEDDNNGK